MVNMSERCAGNARSCCEGGISVAAKISCCRSCTVAFVKSTWMVVTPLGWRSRTGAIVRIGLSDGRDLRRLQMR